MARSKKTTQAKNKNSTTTSTTAPLDNEEQVTVTEQESSATQTDDKQETTLATDESSTKEVKDSDNKANAEPDSKDAQEQESSDKKSDESPSATKDEETSDKKDEESTSNKSEDSANNEVKAESKSTSKATKKKETKRLANSEDNPINDAFKARVIVVTSGKGGVGKTTTAASISTGLALKGHKTVVIDFDVGLRNLDLIMGCERRVVYDFINVLHGEAKLHQALIKDKHVENGNLSILAASQTKDKDSLSYEGVGKVLQELSNMGFEYIICDSPAGIEAGALIALYYADEAIITTNPEISSVRDSDRILGILDAKSRRAVNNWEPVTCKLLLTRYSPDRVAKGEMLSLNDIQELLRISLLGVIPESRDVLKASNDGDPIILNQSSDAGKSYLDAVERLLGNEVPLRFTHVEKSFLQKLFGK